MARRSVVMRSAFSWVVLAAGLACASSPAAFAAPPKNTIDFESSAPTLGELLDQEAREAAARRAPPPKPQPPKVPQSDEETGSIGPRRVTQNPQLPRNAVTVILPHPRQGAGRPVPVDGAPNRR